MLGKAEEELCVAWKHLFPITPTSIMTGNLALDHLAWGTTPNPWWQFITDPPLIIEEVAMNLNKQRRPLVAPHLDVFGWIVQERKVIDFRGVVTSHMGNFPNLKLFQILNTVKRCDLLVTCREDIPGILKYLTVWKLDWMASTDLLMIMGWSMMEAAAMMPNPMEVPVGKSANMNILLWNCRGALNADL